MNVAGRDRTLRARAALIPTAFTTSTYQARRGSLPGSIGQSLGMGQQRKRVPSSAPLPFPALPRHSAQRFVDRCC